jgi:hypothetical protein
MRRILGNVVRRVTDRARTSHAAATDQWDILGRQSLQELRATMGCHRELVDEVDGHGVGWNFDKRSMHSAVSAGIDVNQFPSASPPLALSIRLMSSEVAAASL